MTVKNLFIVGVVGEVEEILHILTEMKELTG